MLTTTELVEKLTSACNADVSRESADDIAFGQNPDHSAIVAALI
jgi:hypothetical protein